MIDSDVEQCCKISLGGSKLVPPQRFSIVSSNAIVVHVTEQELCSVKTLCCSQPIKRNRSGVLFRKSSCTII